MSDAPPPSANLKKSDYSMNKFNTIFFLIPFFFQYYLFFSILFFFFSILFFFYLAKPFGPEFAVGVGALFHPADFVDGVLLDALHEPALEAAVEGPFVALVVQVVGGLVVQGLHTKKKFKKIYYIIYLYYIKKYISNISKNI